jgi:hypothetical protein
MRPSPACLPAASFPLTQRTLEADCLSDSEEDGRTAAARAGPQLQARLAVQAKQVVRLEGVVLDQAQRITQVCRGAALEPTGRPACLPACLPALPSVLLAAGAVLHNAHAAIKSMPAPCLPCLMCSWRRSFRS